ncbi:hypothetical protein ACNKHM_01070 [Shigella sonnei]
MQALRNNRLAAAIDDADLTPDIRADIHCNWSRTVVYAYALGKGERYAIADRALARYARRFCGMITETALPSTSVFG